MSLKSKVAAKCGDLKLLANVMKSYPETDKLNTRCALEGVSFLNLPLGADYNSHRFDNKNYSILRPNTWAKRACIEESLNYAEHDVTHTILVLEIDGPSTFWHIVKLDPTMPKDVGRCEPIP